MRFLHEGFARWPTLSLTTTKGFRKNFTCDEKGTESTISIWKRLRAGWLNQSFLRSGGSPDRTVFNRYSTGFQAQGTTRLDDTTPFASECYVIDLVLIYELVFNRVCLAIINAFSGLFCRWIDLK